MALCTTTTIAAGGRPRRERKPPTIFDPSEYDYKMPPRQPRQPTTARTTAQAAEEASPHAPRQSRPEMTRERAMELIREFHAGSNPQYAIVGKMKEAGASGGSGGETFKAMVAGYMAHDSGLPINQVQPPASLPLDDPTAVALIKAVLEFWGPRYNNFSFDPEALSTLFANLFTEDPEKHAGPKQLFPKKGASLVRDFYDIKITLGTGAFTLCIW